MNAQPDIQMPSRALASASSRPAWTPQRIRRLALGITIAVVMMVWLPLAVAWVPRLAAPPRPALIASGVASNGRPLLTSASGAVSSATPSGSSATAQPASAVVTPVTRAS